MIRCPGSFNYSALNNRAVAESDSEVVVLLNNDIEVLNAEWLSELVAQAIRPEVGAVGAKLLSISFGFSAVLVLALLLYAVVALVFSANTRGSPVARA